ncbi:uncharacterized protein CC84DRAFT_619311 [Paraphaeosphaeria sporulosa]|uniref:Uncharacterized protein n=1 Tax=Paraphaeosphaeria sporulosa TaxID=1460663 RepID=A0A177CIT6_9PLEO|nr:uncharacterized protein CC84DRAFT_619311 [Paraphaeosphaeria sporulosa]OAG06697.1 hypothetical protein CC84DRAFT_619311 [Paraphaeosphaeria sporulosa]
MSAKCKSCWGKEDTGQRLPKYYREQTLEISKTIFSLVFPLFLVAHKVPGKCRNKSSMSQRPAPFFCYIHLPSGFYFR